MVPQKMQYLELLITHKCNRHCDGCANYSNFGLKRDMDFEENKEYLRLWSKRLAPDFVRLLGGEPTLNDRLIDYVHLLRTLWPAAERQIYTNGSFLHRHPGLEEALRETGTSLHISFHSNDPKYLEFVRPGIALLKTWSGVAITWGDHRVFAKMYRGMGRTMLPYEDGNPARSWSKCVSKNCKTISRGRLWKCPEIMGLSSVLEKFGIADVPAWRPYVSHEGIALDVPDEELQRFLAAGSEPYCGMCPAAPVEYRKDVYNVNWERNVERVEWSGEDIDIPQFIASI